MNTKSKRKVWSKEETLLFLKCYDERKDEFIHVRKKKYAYSHVLEDMVFQGFGDKSVTEAALSAKMRTLLSAYKSAKDTGRQTGASAFVLPYMEQMESIFGSNAIISNNHSLNLGTFAQSPLEVTATFDDDLADLLAEPSAEPVQMATAELPSPTPAISRTPTTPISRTPTPAISDTPTPSQTQQSLTPEPSRSRKRKTSRDVYLEEKLNIMRAAEERKAINSERTAKLMEEFVAAKNRQIAVDEKKVKLLGDIFQRQ